MIAGMLGSARLPGTVAVGVLLFFLPVPEGVSREGWRLFAVFAATILGMILQAAENGTVVLLGLLAAIFSGAMTTTAVLAGFGNATVWLIVSAFLFSHAVAATGLGRRVAYLFVAGFGKTPLGLCYALAASELVIAPAVPANTARAGGILFPILTSISEACGSFPRTSPRRLGALLMVNQFHATNLLSAMFLTSMAANPLAAELALKTAGVKISWGLWAAAAALPGAVTLLVLPYALYRMYPPEMRESAEAPAEARRQLAALGPMKRSELVLALIVGGCLGLWTTTSLHGWDATTVALAGLAAMVLAGVLRWKDVVGTSGAWDAMIWFGGLIAMADGLNRYGVTRWLAGGIASHLHGDWPWVLLLLCLAYFYLHYFFASMTAHVTAMYAPFLAVAVGAGAPAVLSALVLAYVSSLNACLTHYSTGPAPILFGAGYVEQGTWWKLGMAVSWIYLAVWLGVGLPYWKVLGLW
jgi:divalent anion:Na+ symporter, DASS family